MYYLTFYSINIFIINLKEVIFVMGVNRFVLNGVSYHGQGAINEIPGIVASKGFKKAFNFLKPIFLL